MGIVKEFRDFAMRGNVIDMAVGIIIGAAFGLVVKTLVDKVMMPPIGMLVGGIDFADKKLVLAAADEAAEKAEIAVYYGEFINTMINFTIVAFALFMVVKLVNTAKKKFEKEQEAAAAASPPEDVVLLREIRDLLAKG